MACTGSCAPATSSTSTDPDGLAVPNLFVSADETVLCYMNGSKVQKWDISNPAAPSHDSELSITNGLQKAFAAVGDTLFVESSDGLNLTIRSIDSTTSPPTELNSINPGTGDAFSGTDDLPRTMAASGNRLYYIEHSAGVGVRGIDITTPSALADLGRSTVDFGTKSLSPKAIAVEPTNDKVIYMAGINVSDGGEMLLVSDWTDPTNPTEIGFLLFDSSLSVLTNHGNLIVKGTLLFLGTWNTDDSTKSFTIFDISTPSSPTVLSTTTIDGTVDSALGMFVSDNNNLYLNSDKSPDGGPFTDGQLEVWDVSNPASPTQCSAVPLVGTPGNEGIAFGASGKLYQAIDDGSGTWDALGVGSFVIYDVTSCESGGGGGGGDGDGVSNFRIYRVDRDNAPKVLSKIQTTETMVKFVRVGHFIYGIADSSSNLTIVDVRKPDAPIEVAGSPFAMGATCKGIHAEGHLLVIATPSGIKSVDVSNAEAPIVLGTAT